MPGSAALQTGIVKLVLGCADPAAAIKRAQLVGLPVRSEGVVLCGVEVNFSG